jgi:hypothetical protein
VEVPAFRKLLARELEKTNAYGSFTWRAPDAIEFKNAGNYARYSVSAMEGGPPGDGTTVEIRWCDWIELTLSLKQQPPFFNPFTSVESRNQQIQSARILLLRK